MNLRLPHGRRLVPAVVGVVAVLVLLIAGAAAVTGVGQTASGHSVAAAPSFYHQSNLVSDLKGTAAVTDPNLVNA